MLCDVPNFLDLHHIVQIFFLVVYIKNSTVSTYNLRLYIQPYFNVHITILFYDYISAML